MVNTFILTNSPKTCVKLLDYRRLGKQRVEAQQIINALEKLSNGWTNHPVTIMWKDHIIGLKYYFNCCVEEWIIRGYVNNMTLYDIPSFEDEKKILPWFYYNHQIQESFKASLLRKDPTYYSAVISCDENYMHYGYIWIGKLNPEQIETMKSNIDLPLEHICQKFGSGTPAHYRISKDVCLKWIQNKDINPITGRTIKKTGSVYKDLEQATRGHNIS